MPTSTVGRLLLLFIVVPVVELMLLIEIGERIGTLNTIALIIGTGIAGASLARRQGLSTLARLRNDLSEGGVPAGPIVEGVLILVAAAVLITPGAVTDVVGFLLLVPPFRRLIAQALILRLGRAVQAGTLGVTMQFTDRGDTTSRPPMKNVTPPRPSDHGRD